MEFKQDNTTTGAAIYAAERLQVLELLEYAYSLSGIDDKELKSCLAYDLRLMPWDCLSENEMLEAKLRIDEMRKIDDPLKAVYKKGIYFHPRTERCQRCRHFKPECFYDKQRGSKTFVCNMCSESLKEHQWIKGD